MKFFFLILDDFFSEPFFFSFGCKKNFKVFFIFNVKVFSLNFFVCSLKFFSKLFLVNFFSHPHFFPMKFFFRKKFIII